jgi:leader peptidase (prepilin peptidase)/N-methyltransferase
MGIYFWIIFVFVFLFIIGSMIGSFLNVCIARLPPGLSLVRPGSRCGACATPIRMRDNIPLVSYWLLRGRCRACGATFSSRYFWVELATGLSFVVLYYLEIGLNIHRLEAFGNDALQHLVWGYFPRHSWLFFGFHALLLCLLLVAVACNLEQHWVPHAVVTGGVLLGLAGGILFPWPWPYSSAEAIEDDPARPAHPLQVDTTSLRLLGMNYLPAPRHGPMPAQGAWSLADASPRAGFYAWPVWGPLPDWLPAGGWVLGLVTGLVGMLAGGLLPWALMWSLKPLAGPLVPTVGDGWILLIAGGCLGWQPVVAAFGLAVGLALLGAAARVRFSVGLPIGIVVAWLGWPWLGAALYHVFFDVTLLGAGILGWALVLLVFGAAARRNAAGAGAANRQ